ncbi:hypothetical protein AA310_05790 [Arthrobacter sp. YC-RL1]|uniref:helix-turn-helix domain-containing protein n=1 Tax=Arthrobacter sp. YC-RL1 TaxID=1652545 RepID=UPI00063DC44C|nr:helix-turn-helix domain-containing protein [Arthrobacter sp. YC-RL1]ALQ31225.1 hypothetical protein ATC04_12095 [Arthrobacter sp. YC-RL1]KLI87518.1 hypothetical protein AA310_05790 [Arthrobacter sp. YC-RL1]
MTYVAKDRSALQRAVISPATAYAILRVVKPEDLRRAFQNVPDNLIWLREQVNTEVQELIVAAQIHSERINTHRPESEPSTPSGESPEPWMTVAEVAQMLGKTDRTVRNYIKAGVLEARRKDEKSYLVDRASAEVLATAKNAA